LRFFCCGGWYDELELRSCREHEWCGASGGDAAFRCDDAGVNGPPIPMTARLSTVANQCAVASSGFSHCRRSAFQR
jgi:hypothetical protein